jgi:D-alanine transaminase
MSRIAYVNGRYVPHAGAAVHIEDRGYQFSDGVYEVVSVHGGHLIDGGPHLDRLDRSLAELRIARAMSRRALSLVIGQVIRRNRVHDGIIYIQMTRGVARRDHAFPADVRTAVVMTARRSKRPISDPGAEGVKVITIPDVRWHRRDIKSVSLLPNVLGKQQAREAGAFEAWQVDLDGKITEGTSTNAWIVTAGGDLVTRDPGAAILNGITRLAVLGIAHELGIPFTERPFSLAEAKAAREAFVTSTTSFVMPVTYIDDEAVGDGRPGPLARALRERYVARMAGEAAWHA